MAATMHLKKSLCYFFMFGLAMALLSSRVVGFEFASPDDCQNVCVGTFAFYNESDARACCEQTRWDWGQPEESTEAPTEFTNETERNSAGIRKSCRNFGGPQGTRVNVRYPAEGEELTQCFLCIGAIREGDECGSGASNLYKKSMVLWAATILFTKVTKFYLY